MKTYLKEEAELTRTRAEFAKVRIELLRAFKDTTMNLFNSFARVPVDRRGELFEPTARGSAPRHVHGKRNPRHRSRRRRHASMGTALRHGIG